MGNFEIQDPPIFQTDITKWSRETNADGDEMGRDMEKVFNNTVYNKHKTEENQVAIKRNAALINREKHVTTVTLTAAGWQGEGPYTQTVDVPDVKENDTPVAKELIPKETTKENEKAIRKAAACISYFETGNGTVTFTCIGKRPVTDFQVVIKGV